MHDRQFQARYRFGHSSLADQETSVSCFIVTAVPSNVHVRFPYPLPRHPLDVLLVESPALTGVLWPLAGPGWLSVAPHSRIAPAARTDAVTSFQKWFRWKKQDTLSGVAVNRPEHRFYVAQHLCKDLRFVVFRQQESLP